MRLFESFESSRPFTGDEAWMLFKLAAYGEAVGWSLLIAGILIKRFIVHGNNLPVLLAGQVHGMLFIVYAIAAIGLYPSLGWRRPRAFIAMLASIPPYGSLLFERWAATDRQVAALRSYSHYLVYTALSK